MTQIKNIIQVNGNTYKLWVTEKQIHNEIAKMAKWIDNRFAVVEQPPILMEVQTGGKYFFVDLHRKLSIDVHVDAIGITSYPEIEKQTLPRITSLPRSNINNRDIILVEDIIDSGTTTDFIKRTFLVWGAKSVTIIALVARQKTNGAMGFYDQVCFVYKGNEWLHGYGMDDAQLGRQLTSIYHLSRRVQVKANKIPA